MATVLASELLTQLQALIDAHGDLPIGVLDEYMDFVSPAKPSLETACADDSDDLGDVFFKVCDSD